MIEFIFTMFLFMSIFLLVYGVYCLTSKPNEYSIANSGPTYVVLCNNHPFLTVRNKKEAYLKIEQLEKNSRL